ncbi:hypothetical protein KM915_18830 [Cytobacillus oceanisediminis]|uniref:hypothetical protein n=1 Tax=Cytobacillus oceanisediminis TaxID=665099 RepID=UPI000551E4D6|nr:hypothetical protein [Cytobacillus oceanisediminis]MBU8732113.1 hypothetical protein [Cytobacillus oceanisediminis]
MGMPFFIGSTERFFNSINVIIEPLRGKVDAASDRRSEKGREGVRSWCEFGQEKRKRERRSPKLVRVRTEEAKKGEKESEVGATSDRKSEKGREGVRSWCVFGQEKRKRKRKSPKLVRVRTEEAKKGEKKSEVDASSGRK